MGSRIKLGLSMATIVVGSDLSMTEEVLVECTSQVGRKAQDMGLFLVSLKTMTGL
jgi:hypothetical protein